MKKLTPFIALFLLAQFSLLGQSFEYVSADGSIKPPFDGVWNSAIAFADVDGDTDDDVLITGSNQSDQPIALLYTNDGSGNYTEVNGTPFVGVYDSAVAFADIDGDGDQDVLITGYSLGGVTATLYTNDGSGNFTEVNGAPFVGVSKGSVAFADIDGDNDMDVLVTGKIESNNQIADLYTNDGTGAFTKVNGTPFITVEQSTISFADFDGDADLDVLITGYEENVEPEDRIATLYKNDGTGVFTELVGTPFEGVSTGSVSLADIDGDSDLDVLIIGSTDFSTKSANLYLNGGTANFTKVNEPPFIAMNLSSAAFVDIDGDNDQDLLITGDTDANNPKTKLYTNDGNGNFTVVNNTPFSDVWYGAIAFTDVDGDADKDVLITGFSSNQRIAKLYKNDGNGAFNEVGASPFTQLDSGSVAFADVDGDTDLDILVTGTNSEEESESILYLNDGNGAYTKKEGTAIKGVSSSFVAFADVDGDNDQDVIITGKNLQSGLYPTELYKNDGSGNFTKVWGAPFVSVSAGTVTFEDVDGDGDQDVLITGKTFSLPTKRLTTLYLNDGSGAYTTSQDTSFDEGFTGNVAFADVDGDTDKDLILTGYNYTSQLRVTDLYTNNGSGVFTKVEETSLEPAVGSVAFADIDGDNDMDVLITGVDNSYKDKPKLYTNDGSGNFSKVEGAVFVGVSNGFIAFEDVDNDGDQDALLTGSETSSISSRLYTNNGSGVFTEVNSVAFRGVENGSVAFADIDADGDKDLFITGVVKDGRISYLYRNTTAVNNPPTAICKNITVNLDANGTISITPADIDNGSNDTEGAVTLAIDKDTFTCSDVGNPVTVTLTVTDIGGRTASCTATVIVKDTIAPTITCPENISVVLVGNEQYTVPDFFASGAALVTDNCDNDITTSQEPASGTALGEGVYTITLNAVDNSGAKSSCTFTATITNSLGIEKLVLRSLKTYPNPATSQFILKNPNRISLKNIHVFDVMGRKVLEHTLNTTATENPIDIKSLKSAMYMLIIQATDGTKTTRIMLKK